MCKMIDHEKSYKNFFIPESYSQCDLKDPVVVKNYHNHEPFEKWDRPRFNNLIYLDIWGQNPEKPNDNSYYENHVKKAEDQALIDIASGSKHKFEYRQKDPHGVIVFRYSYEIFRWYHRAMKDAMANRKKNVDLKEYGPSKYYKLYEYEVHREDLMKQEPKVWVKHMKQHHLEWREQLLHQGSTSL